MDGVTTEHVLERFIFAARAWVSQSLIDDFAIETQVILRQITEDVVFELRQVVLGQHLERARAEYPADWWQAFKVRWFPAWAKKRCPVRMTVIEIDVAALYPRIVAPDRTGGVLYVEQSECTEEPQ